MTADQLFSIASTAALPGWAILIFAPRRWGVLNAVPAIVIPLGLSFLYAMLVLTSMAEAGGGFGDIAGIRTLFANDNMLVAGWVHYLAFDMIIGAHAASMMDAKGVSRILQAPILVLTFMLGPIGWLLAKSTEVGLRPVTRRSPFMFQAKEAS